MATTGQWRASKLVGVDVYNTANEKIGDIDEILIDSSGKVTSVIIGVGGFLGMGQHDVQVQLSELKFVNEPRASTTSGTTTTTTTTTGTATTTTRPVREANERWYPDHAVMNAQKTSLKRCRPSSTTNGDNGNELKAPGFAGAFCLAETSRSPRIVERAPATSRLQSPVRLGFVVIVNPSVVLSVPSPVVLVPILRRPIEHVLSDTGPITPEVGVIFQARPGHRVVVLSHSEKATEAHHGVCHLPRYLINHKPLNFSDLFVVETINVGAFYLIAPNERAGLTLSHCRVHVILRAVGDMPYKGENTHPGMVP